MQDKLKIHNQSKTFLKTLRFLFIFAYYGISSKKNKTAFSLLFIGSVCVFAIYLVELFDGETK